MAERVVPETVSLAARRAFVRTTAQGFATSFTGGISTTALLTADGNRPPWWTLGVTAATVLVSPLVGGVAAYFGVISKGIPIEYQTDQAASRNGNGH